MGAIEARNQDLDEITWRWEGGLRVDYSCEEIYHVTNQIHVGHSSWKAWGETGGGDTSEKAPLI